MRFRIGNFFIYLSLIVLLAFAITLQAQEPDFRLCAGGLVGLMIGLILYLRYRPATVESGRFKSYNKLRTRGSRQASTKPK
jgi:hypothetical protein